MGRSMDRRRGCWGMRVGYDTLFYRVLRGICGDGFDGEGVGACEMGPVQKTELDGLCGC